ncbi:hypothetical protein [Mycobacterium palustre]|uniref:Uncharacterized protein n=1 Tax=Mycobacterium palustre TaxID=153971 RepID=A0A1X1YYW5_9MYCO|nr:hypothetical protein [Mycobacterium palustre]ORW16250.1 hypothetical protein AWC19_22645 [Mycobacterium palustre]
MPNRDFSFLAASIAHTAARELAAIAVPVRMLLGTESPACLGAATAAVAAQIPGATIVAMQGQGYQAIDYDPHQFVRAVLEFDPAQAHSMSVAASVPPSS